MRSQRFAVVLLALCAALATLAPGASAQHGADVVPSVDLPRPALTPGAVFPAATAATVCRPGYAGVVRDVPESVKEQVYRRYGVVHVPRAHEVDHLISLELGGSNAITNLWPEPYAGRWGARVKDRLEDRLHALVCAGSLTLRQAQRAIARNWPAAYRRYVGTPAAAAPTRVARPSDRGGFYASSYPTASTIYCADDPAWRSLSSTYLRHFATWAAAIAAFPRYHLHRPC
jgi:hypothetical protein